MGNFTYRRRNRLILIYFSTLAIFAELVRWDGTTRGVSQSKTPLLVDAFAGGGFGGGGGGFGAGPKSKKTQAGKKKKKQGSIADMMVTKTTKNKRVKYGNEFHELKTSTSPERKGPKLDKWGLPATTIDDIFPPLPASTKLHPVDSSKHHSLSEIRSLLKDHVDLGDLGRIFNEQGVSKIPNEDGSSIHLRLLHCSPPVLALDNFLTQDECRDIRKVVEGDTTAHRVNSATFRGALSTRTSTSWFCHYVDLPVLIAKAHHILGVPLETMEEPQIVRYKGGEEFSWHYDEVPPSQLSNGGQRLATLLVYLTDVPSWKGGGTTFRDLKESSLPSSSSLAMQPQRGSALLFFPSFADGSPDDRTLHKSEVLKEDMDGDDHKCKWIVQMWTHQHKYQAALPAGNSNEAARDAMKKAGAMLGYNNHANISN